MDNMIKETVMNKLGRNNFFMTPISEAEMETYLASCSDTTENARSAAIGANFAIRKLVEAGVIDLNKVLYTEGK